MNFIVRGQHHKCFLLLPRVLCYWTFWFSNMRKQSLENCSRNLYVSQRYLNGAIPLCWSIWNINPNLFGKWRKPSSIAVEDIPWSNSSFLLCVKDVPTRWGSSPYYPNLHFLTYSLNSPTLWWSSNWLYFPPSSANTGTNATASLRTVGQRR